MEQKITDSDINNLLEKWFNAKQEITILEAKCDKYKKYAEQILNSKNTNILSTSYYQLKKQKISRNTISKKDLPKDIWNTYSTKNSYDAYFLTQK